MTHCFKKVYRILCHRCELWGMTVGILLLQATIPGILCGPLTAELVMQSHGRWFPVFIIAAGVNFVGAIIYLSQSAASQIL